MQRRLHQILAIEANLLSIATTAMAEAAKIFSKGTGFVGRYLHLKMAAGERSHENTSEYQEITTTVPDKLDYVFSKLGPYWDSIFNKESANQIAHADLVVDGTVILKDAPATFLLAMEAKLVAVREMFLLIPTHEPGIDWVPDPDKGNGVFKSRNLIQRNRTEKQVRADVIVQATDKFPAQVEKTTFDAVIGQYLETKFTGSISPSAKAAYLARIDGLIVACKRARSTANDTQIEEQSVSKNLISYILGPGN